MNKINKIEIDTAMIEKNLDLFIASISPEITICSGEFIFAGTTSTIMP